MPAFLRLGGSCRCVRSPPIAGGEGVHQPFALGGRHGAFLGGHGLVKEVDAARHYVAVSLPHRGLLFVAAVEVMHRGGRVDDVVGMGS